MYKRDAFQHYFIEVLGGKITTFPSYRSYLNRIDELAGGLDEYIESHGIEGTRAWAKAQTTGPFEKYASDARSILNSYLGFAHAGLQTSAEPGELIGTGNAGEVSAVFKIEKEMQKAIRQDLGALERGLVAVDDGVEATVATGRIDILARDGDGRLVVIELKAGACPSGAIEQVLGYAQTLAEERGEETRAILIASSFSDRQKAAARRAVDLSLRTYSYQLSYENAG